MFTIDDFLSSKIAINCQTEEEAVEFFQWCREECGLTWFNGDTLDNTRWREYRHNKRGQIAYIYREGFLRGLLYDSVAYFQECDTNVVCYSEFFKEQGSDDFEPASDEEFEAFLSTAGYKEG